MPKLLVEKGPDKGRVITITGKDTVIIGRESTTQTRLTDLMASRLHFRIELRSDGYYIVDLKSLNGTFVNAQRITERRLEIGANIQAGENIFSFLSDAEAQKPGLVGKTIGGCKIIERIGRGGMGTVYKALQISLNRVVALKVLSEELVKDKTFINLFVQEARAAAQLNHPNIVQVYDVGKDGETYYFLMEYLPGKSVQDALAKSKKLPPELSLEMILYAARGLEYAERKGIVHRDIKPDNLMISEDNAVKIGDLGLAKSLRTPLVESEEGGIFGTPHYIAPEQALGKPVDHRVDIYSLGCTFYRMLTGVTPYSGSTIKEIITKKIRGDPPPLNQLEPSLTPQITQIVEKMIKRKPDERYQTATELIADLERLKGVTTAIKPGKTTGKILVIEEPPEAKTALNQVVLPTLLLILSGLSLFALIWHYYKAINPLHAVEENGGQKPLPGTEIDPVKEELARKYLEEVEKLHKTVKPDDLIKLGELVQEYTKVVTRFPGTQAAAIAQRKRNELKDIITRLQTSEQIGQKEKELTGVLQNFQIEYTSEYEEILKAGQLNAVEPFIKKWTSKLEKWEKEYVGVPSVFRAREALTKIKDWQKKIESIRQIYLELEKEVTNHITNHKYEKAHLMIKGFIAQYPETIYDGLARDQLMNEVVTEANNDFQTIKLKVNELIKQNNFDEARKLLENSRGSYGIPEVEEKVTQGLKDLEEIIRRNQEAEHQKALERDRDNFYPSYTLALRLANQGKFSDANQYLQNLQPRTPEYQTKQTNIITFLRAEGNTLENLKEYLKKHLRDSSIKPENKIKWRNYPIKEVDNQGIVVLKDRLSTTYEWSKIPPAELYGLINQLLALEKAGTIIPTAYSDLGIFCLMRGGLVKEAETYFRKAVGTKEPEAVKIADQYLSKLEQCRAEREEEVKIIFNFADRYYGKGSYPQALDAYSVIDYRYQNTDLYQQQKDYITKQIEKCKTSNDK